MTSRQRTSLAYVVAEMRRISERLATAEERARAKHAEPPSDLIPKLAGSLSFETMDGGSQLKRLVAELEDAFPSQLAKKAA